MNNYFIMKIPWIMIAIIVMLGCNGIGYTPPIIEEPPVIEEPIDNDDNDDWDTGDGPDIYLYGPVIGWSQIGVDPEFYYQIDYFYSLLFYQKEYGNRFVTELQDETEFYYYIDDISDFYPAETRDPDINDTLWDGNPIVFAGHDYIGIIRVKSRIFLEDEWHWSETQSQRFYITYGPVQIDSTLPEGTYTGPQITTLTIDPPDATVEWRVNGRDWQLYTGSISLVDPVDPSATSIGLSIRAQHPDRKYTAAVFYYTIN
jgi:hypothetical protein